jgi:hypothetical protein
MEEKGDSEKLLKFKVLFTSYNNKELFENHNRLGGMPTTSSHELTLQLVAIHKKI